MILDLSDVFPVVLFKTPPPKGDGCYTCGVESLEGDSGDPPT